MSNQLSRQQRRKAERDSAKQAAKQGIIISRNTNRGDQVLAPGSAAAILKANFEKTSTLISAAVYSYETTVKVTAIFLPGEELRGLLRNIITPYEKAVAALDRAFERGEPVDPSTGKPIPGHMDLTQKWLKLAQRVVANDSTEQDIANLHQFALETLPDMAEAYRQSQVRRAAEVQVESQAAADEARQELKQQHREASLNPDVVANWAIEKRIVKAVIERQTNPRWKKKIDAVIHYFDSLDDRHTEKYGKALPPLSDLEREEYFYLKTEVDKGRESLSKWISKMLIKWGDENSQGAI